MKTIYLEIEYNKIKKSKNIVNKYCWFDVDEKKLKTFSGGSLDFKYDISDNKMKPFTKDLYISSYENESNAKKILSWISDNRTIVSVDTEQSSSQVIAVNTEDNQFDNVIDMIERVGFRYGN